MYVNGKNVASTNASLSISERNKFSIGALVNSSGIINPFRGEIDEVRIWNTARTEEEIRDYMCKKVSSIPSTLKAYYRFDDGANSTTTANLAETAKNASLKNIGFSERSGYAVSGAPIGDISKYTYTGRWTGVSLTFAHTDGDFIGVSNIGTGSPDGIHLYWVNQGPYFKALPAHYEKMGNKKYFGVFAANGADPTYDLTYMYQGNPDAEAGVLEEKHRLLKRDNASLVRWIHSGAKGDILSHSLNLYCKEINRGEYNLGFRKNNNPVRPGSGMALQYNTPDANGKSGVTFYDVPDITDYTITYWAKGQGRVCNLSNRLIESFGWGRSAEEIGILAPQINNIAWEYNHGSDWMQNTAGDTYGVFGDTATWYHYAVTRRGTKVTRYINGNITHQEDLIGNTVFNTINLMSPSESHGKTNVAIDEFTVWNTDLDQQTIRDWMCKKITGEHPYSCKNLLLYFNFDEGQGLTLEDKNGNRDAEIKPGYFNFTVSGAAIGDESKHEYLSPANIAFAHPSGDKLEAKLTSGVSAGIQLYRVDNLLPISSKSMDVAIKSIDSTRYWGLYVCNQPNKVAKYEVSNSYTGNASVKDETTLRMLQRFDNTVSLWSNPTNQVIDNNANTIKIPEQARGEYLLGGTSPATFEFKPPAKPIFLSEIVPTRNNKTICGNSKNLVYKVQKDPSVVTYHWTLPSELDGFSTEDSIVVNASYMGSSPKTVILSVTGINSAGKSEVNEYNITINPKPTLADAGPDQILLPPATSATMDGNTVGENESGTWKISNGTGTIALATDPKTNIANLGNVNNVFIWTIKQNGGICPSNEDSVNILVSPPPINITLLDGGSLPLFICGNTTLSIKAIPEDGIVPDNYIWEMPSDFILISQYGNTAIIQSKTKGIGGTIKVKAAYGTSNAASLSFESSYIAVKSQPNKPVFEDVPEFLCRAGMSINAIVDPSISSYEWTLPSGVLPLNSPKSTARNIGVTANEIAEGYISVRAFNDECTNADAVDSFYVKGSIGEPLLPLEIFSVGANDWAPRRCNGDVIYSVVNPQANFEYVWEWENKKAHLKEYYGDNHHSAMFNISADTVDMFVYAKTNSPFCNIRGMKLFRSFPPDVSFPSYKPDPIIISDPSGQNATDLQIGQTYTLQTSCSTCPLGNSDAGAIFKDRYFWDVPEGINIIKDNNDFDNKITVNVESAVAAPIRTWALTLKGCASISDSLVVSTPGTVVAPIYEAGVTTVCAGQLINITVKDVGADEYLWQLPGGFPVIKTATNVFSYTTVKGMKGNLLVTARKGTFVSEPAKIPVFVKSTVLEPLTFFDADGTALSSLSVCASRYYGEYIAVKISNNHANQYVWEIPGSVIQFEPLKQDFDKNGNGTIDIGDADGPWLVGDIRYEKGIESPHTTGTDTVQYFTFQRSRLSASQSSGNITVTSKNGCGGDDRTDILFYEYAIPAAQQQPVFIDAPTTVCAGSRITYIIKPIQNADQYFWTLPLGLSAIELITTIPQITVDVTNGVGGQISVYATSQSCDKGRTPFGYTEQIKINGKPEDFKFIEAPLSGCLGQTLTYKVSDVGVTTYSWSVPKGLGNDLQGGPSMNFVVNSNVSGSVCVSIPVAGCTAPYRICTDNINLSEKIGDPIFSSQINAVCPNKIYRYTLTDIGASSYTWILPQGWKIGNATGTVTNQSRSVEITAGPLTSSTVKIGAFGTLNCKSKTSPTIYTKDIKYNSDCNYQLAAPIFNTQPMELCKGVAAVYSVNPVRNAQTYEWTLPAGISETGSGAGPIVITITNSISVIGNTAGLRGYIKVKAKYTTVDESNEANTTSEISIKSAETNISIIGNPLCNLTLSSAAISGNQWFKNGELIFGATNQTYSVLENGNYNVQVIDGLCKSDTAGKSKTILNSEPDKTLDLTSPSDLCVGMPSSLIINASEMGVRYSVFVNNSEIGTDDGTGSNLVIQLPATSLMKGSNTITVEAKKEDCFAVTLNQTRNIIVRELNTSLSVTEAIACNKESGLITISSSQEGISYQAYLNNFLVAEAFGTGADLPINISEIDLATGENIVSIKANLASAPASCSASLVDTAIVTVSAEIPKPGRVSGPSEICMNDNVVYSVTAEPGKTYIWEFPVESEQVGFVNTNPEEPFLKLHFKDSINGTAYVTVKVKDGECFSDTSGIEVKNKAKCNDIFIPNIITPNTSDNNYIWAIEGLQNYPHANIKIINRWGGLVYESTGYAKPWKGESKNNEFLPTGTYYYIIDLKDNEMKKQKNTMYTGAVTIVR